MKLAQNGNTKQSAWDSDTLIIFLLSSIDEKLLIGGPPNVIFL